LKITRSNHNFIFPGSYSYKSQILIDQFGYDISASFDEKASGACVEIGFVVISKS